LSDPAPIRAAPTGPTGESWANLLALTLIWGTAFMAIAIAVETLPPATLVATRVAVAALVLCVAARAMGLRPPPPGRLWLRFLLLACVGNALPFTLISWGQERIDSGLAGVLMAVIHSPRSSSHTSSLRASP